MADLYVHSSVLDSMRNGLSTISGRLEGALGELRRLDAEAVGAPPLIDGVDEFAQEWRYGVEQIGRRTETRVQALTKIGQAFDEADSKLAQACRGGAAGGGTGGRA